MFGNILKKIFGSSNERDLRGMRKIALKIKDLEAELKVLNDVDLTAQTAVLKGRLAQGETLEKLLPEPLRGSRDCRPCNGYASL